MTHMLSTFELYDFDALDRFAIKTSAKKQKTKLQNSFLSLILDPSIKRAFSYEESLLLTVSGPAGNYGRAP